jgi:hypothetical protein
VSERRRSLTPLDSELRRPAEPKIGKPSLLERLRRRERRPPTTTGGAVARGLLRLAIAVGAACGVALLIDHLVDRTEAFGFYIVGAAILAIAFMTSASNMGTRGTYTRAEREQRVNWSFAYVLAGAIVVAIGVLIDVL